MDKIFLKIYKKILQIKKMRFLIYIKQIIFGIDIGRKIADFHKLKIRYFFISKNACSSFKYFFLKADLGDNAPELLEINPHGVLEKNNELWLFVPKNNYKQFFVARNPFERLVSCYINKIESRKKAGQNLGVYPLDPFIQRVFKMDINLNFNDFVHRVSLIPDRYRDSHFKSQSWYSRKINMKSDNLFILKLEEFESRKKDFLDFFGLDLNDLKIINKSKDYDWRDYYDEKLAYKVFELYKKDFENFGYENELKNLLEYLNK